MTEPLSKPSKGVTLGIMQGTILGFTKGDTSSLDYGSYTGIYKAKGICTENSGEDSGK